MSLTHWAVLSPFIKVRVKVTFLNGSHILQHPHLGVGMPLLHR